MLIAGVVTGQVDCVRRKISESEMAASHSGNLTTARSEYSHADNRVNLEIATTTTTTSSRTEQTIQHDHTTTDHSSSTTTTTTTTTTATTSTNSTVVTTSAATTSFTTPDSGLYIIVELLYM